MKYKQNIYNYFSKGVTIIYSLNLSDFIFSIKKNNYRDYEIYCNIVDNLKINKQFSLINKYCFSCFKETHMINDCPFL